ncbi:hypothetical protein NIIDMKKI_53390 [Mycobacterium kansasii]|uniref:Uncharacterized protein n=1 Tax=Mycobacterium kansasii TaxID=1768 RepID=A0A7G1IJC7_MYCKA|nr:hypothetical protein NIIDMKKI_53390 [Mycobacterium kansasii]
MLDDAYELGAEGGIVDIMFATFGTGHGGKWRAATRPPQTAVLPKAWKSRQQRDYHDSKLASFMNGSD